MAQETIARSSEVDLPLALDVPLTRLEDGTLRVRGTRVPIDTIVTAYWMGESPEQIHLDFSTVGVAEAYAVIAWYLQHREAVDVYLRLREREAEEIWRRIEAEYPTDDIRARLKARLHTLDTSDRKTP
jgi:uncharacterized protein (DUF433 family)